MPARLPLDELRAAMEEVTGATATVSEREWYARVTVPMPTDAEAYEALLKILVTADAWGSYDHTGSVRVWATLRNRDAES
ncbi:hypothetical protein [Streptomyces sp. NPDC057403]|uniref:hypothetical protein n=1 Tax=Streptomyces sp. NPDC057403 TaxID=3346119 RepID=UPI0036CC0B32